MLKEHRLLKQAIKKYESEYLPDFIEILSIMTNIRNVKHEDTQLKLKNYTTSHSIYLKRLEDERELSRALEDLVEK